MKLSWIIWVGPKSSDTCPCKRETERRHRNPEEGHVMTEAVTGMMCPPAKDCWQPPVIRREAWDRFSPLDSRRSRVCPHFGSGRPAFRNGKEYISAVLSHPQDFVIAALGSERGHVTICEGRLGTLRKDVALQMSP